MTSHDYIQQRLNITYYVQYTDKHTMKVLGISNNNHSYENTIDWVNFALKSNIGKSLRLLIS